MNYIKTTIFLLIFTIFLNVLGIMVKKVLHLKNKTFAFQTIAGFFFLFLLGFIVGFPSELLSLSWNSYFCIYTVLLLIVFIISVIYSKHELINYMNYIKRDPLNVLLRHLKKYWFIYCLVLAFSILSMTNTQPYLWANYHDDYYIAKMVHLKGAAHLLDEDYVTGAKLVRNSFFSYPLQQGYRTVNTYELTYAYLSSISTIDMVFFCRVTFTLYIYLICFFTYKIFVEIFCDANISQYALVFFALLMIPSGFMGSLDKFSVRMFENWRFQTAIFYGGSVVRVIGLPLIVLAFLKICKKFTKYSLIVFVGIALVLLSFQFTAICYLLFVLPILIVVYIVKSNIAKFNTRKGIKLSVIIVTLFVILIITADKWIPALKIFNEAKYASFYDRYLPYYQDVFIKDTFALYAFIPLIMILYIFKKNHYALIATIVVLLCYSIFKFNFATKLLSIITSYTFYGLLRVMTSILLFTVIYWGILFLTIVSRLKRRNVIVPMLEGAIVISLILCIFTNQNKLKKYQLAGQNMTPLGYSIKPLTNNDKMMPDMFIKVGNYINKLPKKKYLILSEGKIPYKNTYVDNINFLLVSPNTQLWLTSQNYEMDDYSFMTQFLTGKKPYYYAEYIFKKVKFDYVFTNRVGVKDQLLMYNYKVVLENKNEHYWLITA